MACKLAGGQACSQRVMKAETPLPYQGTALVADPIYDYIPFTVPDPVRPAEKTEQDLIDSPWMQRLRRIHQLQSARWVYPSAEHTRFQHSLGTMHMAGQFARQLYPSLKAICTQVPSRCCVEETFRIAGLLHDIGHGPYGHFFDDNFLAGYGLTHEGLGKEIIVKKLGTIIKKIRRSPSGIFRKGEGINPADIGFLIKKPPERSDKGRPRWLQFLQQLFSGIYTVDNLDYVQRDAYMTGFSLDIVDINRILFYSFFSEHGLTLHQAGISAFTRFVNARLNLYANVYYHRTGRAIDFHMQEIFGDTMAKLFPGNPRQNLNRYLLLNDWSLIQEVETWQRSRDADSQRLGRQWADIINRRIKWKMAYSTELTIDTVQKGLPAYRNPRQLEQAIRDVLPRRLQKMQFRVDLATQDPRPLNPMAQSNKRINIYNPSTGETSPEPLQEIFKYIPARVVHFRVFALNHKHDAALAEAAEKIIYSQARSAASETNL
ncbi:MAG: HD domain-containing protein [Deltaproteobacteria bacterium]|nr:HD domain-containing protein [Deltaproteobacteria bacterium]